MVSGAALDASQKVALFPLKTGLEFIETGRSPAGAPRYTLYDPKSNSYFRLGWREYEILSRWRIGATATALLNTLHRDINRTFSPDHIQAVEQFARQNNLLDLPAQDRQGWVAEAREKAKENRRLAWRRQAGRLLYWRIRLFDPQPLLDAVIPFTGFLTQAWFWRAWGVAALMALGLVATNLDAYFGTFDYLATPAGIALMIATFLTMKVLHELGHALIAAHKGIRVPSIGVAFLFLWPVFYTDVTHSWRLKNKLDRVLIDLSGVLTEISFAILATLLWALWEDGAVRSILFVISSTTWLISIAVNINPLMKFDGYYAFSDYLDEPNLMTRSQAYLGWSIEKGLYQSAPPEPEPYDTNQRRLFMLYGCASLVYRILILLVVAYGMFLYLPRALYLPMIGIIFTLSVAFPLYRFFGKLHRNRSNWDLRKVSLKVYLPVVILLLAFFLPLKGHGTGHAILRSAEESLIYSPGAGRVTSVFVEEGQMVSQGDVLAEIIPFDLENRIRVEQSRLRVLDASIAQIGLEDRATRLQTVLMADYAAIKAELEALQVSLSRYQLIAPQSGEITVLAPSLKPGAIVGSSEPLSHIRDRSSARVFAYIEEADVHALNPDDSVLFYPDTSMDGSPITGRVMGPPAQARVLLDPELATQFGGPIAVREITDSALADSSTLQPVTALFRVEVQLQRSDKTVPNQLRLGRLRYTKPAVSMANRLFNAALRTYYRYFYL